ncbi:DUF721 domain-containing protein [Altibacter sp. HG106]|uniref:DUF721 domain-containing protein n=1 Tax=Altibacter sp. HG106 TaxID=3023937 RepID=UPI002350E9A3|nr:DUF721 domain-containing protein [Altibacter sp. HG106]MDC7995554.1 DUF721 domain-containing protein [Altibacter sp. HG106]
MSKRTREHMSLAEGLQDFLGNSKLKKGLNKVSAEEAWHQVMGDAISKYTARVNLDRDTLYVDLTSSVLREELSYGKEKIIRLLNEELQKELIKKIVLK